MSRPKQNILFTHSGGVTSVVNVVAEMLHRRVLQDNRQMFIARYGIDGLLNNELLLSDKLSKETWKKIGQSPGSCFGSSRKRIPENHEQLEALFKTLDQHNIGTFFCNGGNNSQHITHQMDIAAKKIGYSLNCIGIPKTIDNDIMHTDTCPGFGSAAKYTATSVYEMALDLAAMCHSSTQVLIYEAMGRDAGWLAASAGLARKHPHQGPHIILLPEAQFSLENVIEYTKRTLQQCHHCVIVLAEGASDQAGKLQNHPYPYKSLFLNEIIQKNLGVKTHVVLPDYLQRSARHLASKTDIEQTQALSYHAYDLALASRSGIMTSVRRDRTEPYEWSVSAVELSHIAGKVRMLPSSYLREDHLHVSQACIKHLLPLIQGEAYPQYHLGLPDYSQQIYQEQQ